MAVSSPFTDAIRGRVPMPKIAYDDSEKEIKKPKDVLLFSKRELKHDEYMRDPVSDEPWHICAFSVPYEGVWDNERAYNVCVAKCIVWWKTDFRKVKLTDVTFNFDETNPMKKILKGGTFIMTVVLLADEQDMKAAQYGAVKA